MPDLARCSLGTRLSESPHLFQRQVCYSHWTEAAGGLADGRATLSCASPVLFPDVTSWSLNVSAQAIPCHAPGPVPAGEPCWTFPFSLSIAGPHRPPCAKVAHTCFPPCEPVGSWEARACPIDNTSHSPARSSAKALWECSSAPCLPNPLGTQGSLGAGMVDSACVTYVSLAAVPGKESPCHMPAWLLVAQDSCPWMGGPAHTLLAQERPLCSCPPA